MGLLRDDLKYPATADIDHVQFACLVLPKGADVKACCGQQSTRPVVRGSFLQLPDFSGAEIPEDIESLQGGNAGAVVNKTADHGIALRMAIFNDGQDQSRGVA